MRKKYIRILVVCSFLTVPLFLCPSPAHPESQATSYLIELGEKFYARGQYGLALQEFKKALMVSPDSLRARQYIARIEGMGINERDRILNEDMERYGKVVRRRQRKVTQSVVVRPQGVHESLPSGTGSIPAGLSDEEYDQTPSAAERREYSSLGEEDDVYPRRPSVSTEPDSPSRMTPVVKEIPVRDEELFAGQRNWKLIDSFLDEFSSSPAEAAPVPAAPIVQKAEIITNVPRVILDDRLKENVPQTKLEIEQGKSLVIEGEQISRWLAIAANIVDVERKSSDEIVLTAKDIGTTLFHVWDSQDRWTFDIRTLLPRPIGPTLAEELRRAQERAKSFKVRYSFDWNMFERGRRIDDMQRQSYSYSHLLGIDGKTPYGDLSFDMDVEATEKTTDLTYANIELREGHWGFLNDFTLKGLDYSTDFSNLAFSGASLRGVFFQTPVFHDKVDYRIFWGREGGGRYGGLSPGLADNQDSYLSGFNMTYYPWDDLGFGTTVIKGWGEDRETYLNDYNYDWWIERRFDSLTLRYEAAYDSNVLSHLGTFKWRKPKIELGGEVRYIDRDYVSATEYGWRRGEYGGMLTLDAYPTEKLSISSRVDVFQDRVFPNPDNYDRWNTDFDFETMYRFSDKTSLRFDYRLANELGRLSPYRSQTAGMQLSQTWDWWRTIYTYVGYRRQENKNFTTPSLDYLNDQATAGLRMSIVGDLYWYANKEINWLQERATGIRTEPEAFETGLDWYGKFFNTLVEVNSRVTYRDEEDAASALSFLSGEDYLEFYNELNYSPQPDLELYLTSRVRNVWADSANVDKRIEFDVYAGMRFLWDTGFRWEPQGKVSGYVFKDENFDGKRQAGEKGVSGVSLWLGKNKSAVTDSEGFYEFPRVRAEKAYVNIDTQTIPSGFLLTVPATQEGRIVHKDRVSLNFGIASHSEIYGIVFEDVNGDGEFTSGIDEGVPRVRLRLEDGTETVTDSYGRYSFRRAATGPHTVNIELESLPIEYLPKVPLTKELVLFENVSFMYNIPVAQNE